MMGELDNREDAKHTLLTDVDALCLSVAKKVVPLGINVDQDLYKLKQRWITEDTSNRLLIETARKGLMPWSFIGKFLAEFEKDCAENRSENRRMHNLGRLNRVFSNIIAPTQPLEQMDKKIRFLDLLCQTC